MIESPTPGATDLAAPALNLEVEAGPRAGLRVAVDQVPFLIGRDRQAHLCLDDRTVSRLHAAIVQRQGEWVLQDLGGRNPPLVHGRPVISVALQEGDRVQIGAAVLRVVLAAGPFTSELPDSSKTVEIPAHHHDLAPHRAQQLAGRPLWEVLVEWTELVRHLDHDETLFERALDGWLKLIPADRIGIYRREPDGRLEAVASRHLDDENPLEYSETIVAQVVRDRVAKLYSPEVTGESDLQRSRSMIRKRIRTALCIPLLSSNEVWGIVYLDQTRAGRPPLLGADLELGNLLAHWLAEAIEKAERFRDMGREILQLRSGAARDPVLIGESAAVQEIRRRIRKVAATDVSVLIGGESGTGKELVARGLHRASRRAEGPFVAINCAAIPENLLESELFGYAPHSGISGSDPAGKPGRFELASGGTLFLDEVGELAPALQAKLLRVVEDQCVDRIGSRQPVRVDVRFVAATNRDLMAEVQAGRFREDLYYRLRVFPIEIPPLRDRPEDIFPIAHHLMTTLLDGGEPRFTPRAQELIRSFAWPGNVRQLRNVLLEALLIGDGRTIQPRDLPTLQNSEIAPFLPLREVERRHIVHVLEGVKGNKKKAAELLGIHRSTLYEKLNEHQLEPSPDQP